MKGEISEYLKAINCSKEVIKALIEGKFGKKSNSSAFKNAFSTIAKVENFDDPDLYIKLINNINFDEQPLPTDVDETIFLNLINQKCCSLVIPRSLRLELLIILRLLKIF